MGYARLLTVLPHLHVEVVRMGVGNSGHLAILEICEELYGGFTQEFIYSL